MARRVGLVVVLALLGTLAPVGVGGAFGAPLPQVPRATACAGGAWLLRPVPSAGNTISLDVGMACGTHWVIFAGNAVPNTLADLCAGGLISLQFVGTESVDYAPPSATAATWNLQGRDGTFVVTTQNGAGGAMRVGTIVAGGCDQSGSSGTLVLAQATTASSLPDVFSCHAAVNVSPQDIYSGRGGWEITGPATGTGTCQSTNGAWDALLNGTWTLPGGQTCGASTYGFPLQLTGPSGTQSVSQGWAVLAQDHQAMTVYGVVGLSGVGQIVETADPCAAPPGALPPSFQATADWVFFAE